ncbi:MAG: helix-turn-helix transcriptional regulator [Intestinibacter sp.]|uniref:helix-turn-helix domain-containing protein n=1 Tax=Intestinibacter sp. TaxID=1965304 RepID=UPI002A81CF2A|nr:helix-turn-helix transcriptional regulator [Intestinibacter sp.]MDY4575941.1 helix-turn-helix transcriptional regulator [Intestinibacter sp.]
MEDLSNINIEIGKKIKNIRKGKNMTIQELADSINKSKSTVSKYENGDISVDVQTLYEISNALNVHVEQLLYIRPNIDKIHNNNIVNAFFRNSSKFYSYIYDGRSNEIIKCVIDIIAHTEDLSYKTMLYMNVKDFDNYQNCENTYYGFTKHYDTLTSMILQNQATPLEQISINILASFLDTDKIWGLMSGVSFRPFMPIALKMLFSKKPLEENNDLAKELKISKDDIKLMKLYNMFTVTQ